MNWGDKFSEQSGYPRRVLQVSELNKILRGVVQSTVREAWVAGEVQQVSISARQHVYFTLKDEGTGDTLEAAAFNAGLSRMARELRKGARVLVHGYATVWVNRGKLQFVVDSVRPQGRGELLAALERLKKTLEAEGLFARENKLPVPSDARLIGVVTSRSGAVIHDIRKVAFRRGSPRIILSPAQVQGEQAVESMIRAFDLLEKVRGLDVIIIGRGGGSDEDLLPFYDERLVRRLAARRVPVVSAVGHETNLTFTDMVADERAATPSEAAEKVVADRSQQRQVLVQFARRLVHAAKHELRAKKHAQQQAVGGLDIVEFRLDEWKQNIDELYSRLAGVTRSTLGAHRKRFSETYRLAVARHPRAVLVQRKSRLERMTDSMVAACQARLSQSRQQWQRLDATLRALSPLEVLERGYAIVSNERGEVVTSARLVGPGQRLGVRLRDGTLHTQVESVDDTREH